MTNKINFNGKESVYGHYAISIKVDSSYFKDHKLYKLDFTKTYYIVYGNKLCQMKPISIESNFGGNWLYTMKIAYNGEIITIKQELGKEYKYCNRNWAIYNSVADYQNKIETEHTYVSHMDIFDEQTSNTYNFAKSYAVSGWYGVYLYKWNGVKAVPIHTTLLDEFLNHYKLTKDGLLVGEEDYSYIYYIDNGEEVYATKEECEKHNQIEVCTFDGLDDNTDDESNKVVSINVTISVANLLKDSGLTF